MWFRSKLDSLRSRSVRPLARPKRHPATRLVCESLDDRLLLSVYAVINTNDSGEGSLRQAIVDANAHTSEANAIIFDIRGEGTQTIGPLSPLPTITNPVTIDATFQPGYAGSPLIGLDGYGYADGLTINADTSVVRGLDITRFSGLNHAGVRLQGNGDRLESCYVGTDPTGTQRLGNYDGVVVSGSNDLIGDAGAGAGNLISGNSNTGILIDGNNNLVQGNTIGTDKAGTQRLVNDGAGVVVSGSANFIGGTGAGAGNLISGNSDAGIAISGTNNLVQGNRIGTDVTGTQALGNGVFGVYVSSGSNTIGGTVAGAGNLISGNGQYGILLGSSGNLLQGNLIGTDITAPGPLEMDRLAWTSALGQTRLQSAGRWPAPAM
jgi:hypothetical protein